MADKYTVTMYHPEAEEPIEVLPGSGVKNAKVSGWTTEKPIEEKPPPEPVKKNKPKSTKAAI